MRGGGAGGKGILQTKILSSAFLVVKELKCESAVTKMAEKHRTAINSYDFLFSGSLNKTPFLEGSTRSKFFPLRIDPHWRVEEGGDKNVELFQFTLRIDGTMLKKYVEYAQISCLRPRTKEFTCCCSIAFAWKTMFDSSA